MQTVQSVKAVGKTNYLVPAIINMFHKLISRGQVVTLTWIPGHLGIRGNEEADKIANLARNSLIQEQFLTPFSDVQTVCKKGILKTHEESMSQQFVYKGKIYHSICPQQNSKPSFHKMGLGRNQTTLINRMRAGHCRINSLLYRLNIVDTAECECGHSNQDLNHLLWECTRFDGQRTKLTKDLIRI